MKFIFRLCLLVLLTYCTPNNTADHNSYFNKVSHKVISTTNDYIKIIESKFLSVVRIIMADTINTEIKKLMNKRKECYLNTSKVATLF